jgi:archaemetzincin
MGTFSKLTIKSIVIIALAAFVVGLSSCDKPQSANKDKGISSQQGAEKKSVISVPNLLIVNYSNVPQSVIAKAQANLSPYFGDISVVNIDLPDSAYYKPRNRYLTMPLLRQLQTLRKTNTLVLGITVKDVSTPIHGYENFGIMGQSLLNQHVAVVSTWRVGNVKHLQENDFKKLMLHELAHSVGLNHCKTNDCILHDAEKKNRFSYSPFFCDTCIRQLTAKGWKF